MEATQTKEHMMSTASETTMHPFERAKLGTAPFRFIGCVENAITYPDGTTQAGGTCDYCGNGIRYEYRIESSDRKVFKVGCDCVNKLARKDNAKRDPLIVEINDARREIERTRRHANEQKKIDAGLAKFEAHWGWLNEFIVSHYKGQPTSMADRVEWYMENAGNAGKIKILKHAGWLIDSMLCMGGTVTGALRKPAAVEIPAPLKAGDPIPMTMTQMYDLRDLARDYMYNLFGHSKYNEWPDDKLPNAVADALRRLNYNSTDAERAEVLSMVPWYSAH